MSGYDDDEINWKNLKFLSLVRYYKLIEDLLEMNVSFLSLVCDQVVCAVKVSWKYNNIAFF